MHQRLVRVGLLWVEHWFARMGQWDGFFFGSIWRFVCLSGTRTAIVGVAPGSHLLFPCGMCSSKSRCLEECDCKECYCMGIANTAGSLDVCALRTCVLHSFFPFPLTNLFLLFLIVLGCVLSFQISRRGRPGAVRVRGADVAAHQAEGRGGGQCKWATSRTGIFSALNVSSSVMPLKVVSICCSLVLWLAA